MAQVDFSNAVLDVYAGKPLTQADYLYLNANSALSDINRNVISSSGNKNIILNTPSKVSILYTGAFTASGTEFYLSITSSGGVTNFAWKVSNISFNNGDTYSFVIDIEVSGNT